MTNSTYRLAKSTLAPLSRRGFAKVCDDVGSRHTPSHFPVLRPHVQHGRQFDKDAAFAESLNRDVTAAQYKLYAKRSIPSIFRRFAPHMMPLADVYYASACVFPMRANNYVLEHLIDWSKVPHDPIFRLVFPQPDMLPADKLSMVISLLGSSKTRVQQQKIIEDKLRADLNPHPADQKRLNVPQIQGQSMQGIQHKYRETALFFPAQGQFCHSFCSYCFRWAQFTSVGSEQQFKSGSPAQLRDYVARHADLTDILLTGGDPMVMRTEQLASYIRPLLQGSQCRHLGTIRIGTKSLAYWPYRFTEDADAAGLLDLLSDIVRSGRSVSLMAHFSHPRQLESAACQEAIRRIRATGAQIRCQAPLIRHINDDAGLWADMWTKQVRLGLIPYYMFVERDTGARDYFAVPLATALDIYNSAITNVSGLGRTARGPSMSAGPGKVHIVGRSTILGEDVFVLKFLQARNPAWCRDVFFAKFDEQATWLDQLQPAFGQKQWPWEAEFQAMREADAAQSSGQRFPATVNRDSLQYHSHS